ncbi:CaiB/BaiF CoA-transferase family protein [Ruegeria sp. PrR005]|uniref:CoA transferase n=1 Tax=Ruegeria sp. PrR005 TaxID=2706882 RepID=A0A6B2NVW1_9RHOB|nr:CoA transferase [Ruegeria sp. PrR005]NDW46554.1 CoA transferase [Ruegeria sp. PrR005]
MSNQGILSGIRVLDLSRVMSGPFCTSMLADLGAEVIKIEMPGMGDDARHFGPYKDGESTYFILLNRNKKSVTVNMKSPEGQALIRNLIPKCDVIVENFRPGVMARLGLDEPSIRALNPSIVYTSLSGFGQDGPFKDLPAFDLVIQAMSGLMSLTGPKGGPATAVGESLADVCSGMFAAFGTLAALFDRERNGKGHHVDVAMLDSVMSMQLTGLARQLYMDDTPAPVGNRHPVTYPVDSFAARDGDIVLVCYSNKLFAGLAELIGQPELAEDPRFRTNADRNRNEGELRELIAQWARRQSQSDAVDLLLSKGIPVAPVWNLKQLTTSTHVSERELIAKGTHDKLGEIPLVPQPVRFSGMVQTQDYSSPTLGQHTDEILKSQAGLSDAEIAALRQAGTI